MPDGIYNEFINNELIGIEYKKIYTIKEKSKGILSIGQILQTYYNTPTELSFRNSRKSKNYYISDINIANNLELIKAINPGYCLLNAVDDYISALYFGTVKFIKEKDFTSINSRFTIYKEEINGRKGAVMRFPKELSNSFDSYFPHRSRGVISFHWADETGNLTENFVNSKQVTRIHMIYNENDKNLINELKYIKKALENINNTNCIEILGTKLNINHVKQPSSSQATKFLHKLHSIVENFLKIESSEFWTEFLNKI